MLLAIVKQRGILLQDVSMLYWKCWLPQGASLEGGSCAEVSCICTLHFPKLARGVSRWGDASQSKDSTVKHSEHQTAPYISHIVGEEVETLTPLINVLLVLQRPNVGSGCQGAQHRATVHSGKLGCAG